MTIKLTFEFDTVAQVRSFVYHLPFEDGEVESPPAPKSATTKRVRTARPEAPVEAAAPVAETPAPVKAVPKVADAPVQAVAAVGLDAVRGALREVFNVKGAAAATELLKQFGAARVGEVKPADYDKFIAACGK